MNSDYFAILVQPCSQAEAEAGSNNTKPMTPLRAKQQFDELIAQFNIYVANQTDFRGSYSFGNGLRNLVHVTGEDGWDNIAIGLDSGLLLTTGRGNTLVGSYTGRDMTASSTVNSYAGSLGNCGNTYVGRSIGSVAQGALDNTMVGINCGQNMHAAMDNCGTGANTLRDIGGGSVNAAYGHAVFQHLIGYGGFDDGDGHRMTGIGDNAGRMLNGGSVTKTGGKASVYVGAWTFSQSNSAFNENVFGYYAEGRGSNTVVIGNDDITDTWLHGAINIGGDASTRVLSAGGNVYIESDSAIYMRDTSSAANNWLLANDGRMFLKNDVNHSDLEGAARFHFASSGGATTLYGVVNIGDATTRTFNVGGVLYIESDVGIYFRDTSSSANLFAILSDGQTFAATDVFHSSWDGTARLAYITSGATQFNDAVDFVGSTHGHGFVAGGGTKLATRTVETLPSAASSSGLRFQVANSPTIVNRIAFSNGSAWYYEGTPVAV